MHTCAAHGVVLAARPVDARPARTGAHGTEGTPVTQATLGPRPFPRLVRKSKPAPSGRAGQAGPPARAADTVRGSLDAPTRPARGGGSGRRGSAGASEREESAAQEEPGTPARPRPGPTRLPRARRACPWLPLRTHCALRAAPPSATERHCDLGPQRDGASLRPRCLLCGTARRPTGSQTLRAGCSAHEAWHGDWNGRPSPPPGGGVVPKRVAFGARTRHSHTQRSLPAPCPRRLFRPL